MKKIMALLLAVLVMAPFVSCSDSGQESKADSKADSVESSSKAESTQSAETSEESIEDSKSQSTSNTTYDVGEFTVFVPEGWQAVPVPDHIDPSKTATNDIKLVKGDADDVENTEWTSDDGQSFYITYLSKEDFAKVPEQRDYYVEEFGSVKDMEKMTTGSLTWQGFSVSPIGADVYMIWAASGEGGYYSSVSTAYGLSLQDQDVQTILGSLK